MALNLVLIILPFGLPAPLFALIAGPPLFPDIPKFLDAVATVLGMIASTVAVRLEADCVMSACKAELFKVAHGGFRLSGRLPQGAVVSDTSRIASVTGRCLNEGTRYYVMSLVL